MSRPAAKLIEPINASFDEVLSTILKTNQDGGAKVLPLDVDEKENELLSKWLNKVHPMDCLELMRQLPDESIGVIVTSPPYNIKNSTGNGLKNGSGGKWPKAALIEGYDTYDDNLPHEKYVEWQRECLTEMMRIIRPDGAIFYNHKWRVQNGLLQGRKDITEGFPVRQIIIWKRAGGINFNAGYYLPTYEVIYMICKPDFKLAPGANKMTDIWEIPQVKSSGTATFPIELPQRCIQSTLSGVVLDPFMGSGTTAVAAIIEGRNWIGSEISPEYRKLSATRIESFTKKGLQK